VGTGGEGDKFIMGRIWLLATLLYAYGHPGFDGHRPAAVDRPLRGFHRAVDTAADETRRILLSLDNRLQTVRTLVGNLRQLNDVF